MSDDKPYREWKLLISDMEITVYDESEFDSCPDPDSENPDLESSAEELVHVIEVSAIKSITLALSAKNKELMDVRQELAHLDAHYKAEIAKLKQRSE